MTLCVQDKLTEMEHNELRQAEAKQCQSGPQSSRESLSKNGRFQRQISQMSDYVSDQYFESVQVHCQIFFQLQNSQVELKKTLQMN